MGDHEPDAAQPEPAPLPGPPTLRQPLKIGIWCDFGQTLLPHEGIGVFVHSLASGLLSLKDPVTLTMATHPGDHEVMNELRAEAPDRVRVLPEPEWEPQFRRRGFRLVGAWMHASRWIERRRATAPLARDRRLARLKTAVKDGLKALLRRGWAGRVAAVAAVALAVVPLWAAFAAANLLKAILRTAVFPVAFLDLIVRRMWISPRLFAADSYQDIIRQADCDVWIIPYVGFEYPINFPAVIVIHDLVVFHFPELFESRFVEHLRAIVPRRAREATMCACMSRFIEETDLRGLLGLPPEKVRMIRPAAPGDLPRMSKQESSRRKPSFLRRPYLFLPSAFRGYKNHGRLIEALEVLRRQFGEDRFDLVFTGREPHELPADLDALARRLGVRDRIHVLGRVDRLTLTALYHEAFATIMPSLYEQGSFPVYEALTSGCPVACSDIPSMREQCAAMGDAMAYFDPYDATAVARTVLAIRDDREGFRRRQQEASAGLWERTWETAAAEWLPVLREAAERSKRATPPPESRPAAA
jgi:glycosyltransferase involved in cell wall biosynthesis